MEPGYPPIVLLLVLLAGGLTVLFRPYWAFLLAVVLFNAPMVYDAVNTRTALLGPYFNLYDALFVVAAMALLLDRPVKPLFFPRPALWVLGIIAIGVVQTALQYQVNYYVLRAIRWALTFPLAFIISANLVINNDRARLFLYALILATTIGAVRGFFDYQEALHSVTGGEALRLSTAGAPLSACLLVAGLQVPFFPKATWLVKGLWGGVLIVISLTILFSQWRSTWLAILITMPAISFLLGEWRRLGRSALLALVGIPLVLLTLHLTLPQVNPTGFLKRIIPLLEYMSSPENIRPEDISRVRQIKRELEEWKKGNYLVGRGLSFNVFLSDGFDKKIAWGHVGYISYLSHLGLLGLFIFGLYLPFRIFQAGRHLYSCYHQEPVGLLGFLAMVTVLMISIVSFMSTSYLSPTQHTTGFLYGAVWTLACRKSNSFFTRTSSGYTNTKKAKNHHYTIGPAPGFVCMSKL